MATRVKKAASNGRLDGAEDGVFTTRLTISPPKFQQAQFDLIGISPLVVHRFSSKTKQELKWKMETGKAASSRKNREAKSTDELFQEARYISKEGWDGVHASAFRNAMVAACRLTGFPMTLAKLSFFVIEDGRDALEPQIPLVRIWGEAQRGTAGKVRLGGARRGLVWHNTTSIISSRGIAHERQRSPQTHPLTLVRNMRRRIPIRRR